MLLFLANEGQPQTLSWPTVVVGIVSLLFGGHGFLTLWLKSRKDVVQSLIQQNGNLSSEVGEIRGKVAILEGLLKEMRKEKHLWRDRSHRYRMMYECERLYADDTEKLLTERNIPLPPREKYIHAKKPV